MGHHYNRSVPGSVDRYVLLFGGRQFLPIIVVSQEIQY